MKLRPLFLAAGLALLAALPGANATPRDKVAIILFTGQSNAGAGGAPPGKLTAPVHPDRVFSFAGARQSYGTARIPPERLTKLGALSDDRAAAPFPATAMAEALAASREGRFFFHTAWYGGRPLADFRAGTVAYSNLLDAAAAAKRVLGARGMESDVTALVLIQGEAGPPKRSDYAALLGVTLDQLLRGLRSATEQSEQPTAILVQTGTSNANIGYAAEVGLAQWDVASARADTVLAGPTYQLPLSDNVHHSAEGRMMLGEILALAYKRSVGEGRPFRPLYPLRATRSGSEIRIDFARPDGAEPLAFDETWVPPVPNRGFDVTGDGPLAIADVGITGPSQVTLRLDRDPGGPVSIGYGMMPNRVEGWAPLRGQLYAPTLQRSHFAALGYQVPETLAHYAIRFVLRTD